MAFPLLNFAAGLGSNLLFNSINQSQYRQNQRYSQQLAQENAMFQDDLTRKLTRDTPLLEKQGLVNAGISPANIHNGTMAAQQGAPVNMPSVNTAPYFSESMPSYTSLLQSSLVSSEIDKNRAQAKNMQSDSEVKNQQAQQLSTYNQYQGDILKQQLNEVVSRIKINKEQAQNLRAQAEKTWSEWELLVPKTQMAKSFAQAEYDTMQRKIAEIDQSIEESRSRAHLADEQAQTENSKRAVNMSQATLNLTMSRYNGILADFAQHGISLNNFVGSIAGLLSQDNGLEFAQTVFNNLSSVVSQAGEQMIPQLLKSLVSGIIKLPKGVVSSLVEGITKGTSNK